MSRPIFRKYASFAQLQIATLEDMERLETLDEARWTATSVPIEQLVADPALLAYVDTDHNGRIRVVELKEARRWLWARLRRRERVIEGTDTLLLDDLDPGHEDTPKVRDLAALLLSQLGARSRDRIDLVQARAFKAVYMARFPNGDGVVSLAQIADPVVRELAADVLAVTGGGRDLSGELGVRREDLAGFRDRVARFVAWSARREAEAATLFPLGENTQAASELVAALTPKIDQFFAQCALVALEAGASARLQASPEELARLDVSDPVAIQRWLERAPIARPTADGVLSLDGPINPPFAAAIKTLAQEVGPRALRREGALTRLDAAEWASLLAVFEPFRAWSAARPEGIAPDADAQRLGAWLEHPALQQLGALVAEDEGVAEELQAYNTLERLLLYQRWLVLLANNIVSMPDLFEPERLTLFQRGTLVLDGRRIQLCVKVDDIASHKAMAATSLIFLLYVRLTRREGEQERSELIAAGVTTDIRGGIGLNKRGVFYDRDNREWDAIVVDLIEHPISVREAMIAPFLRIRDQIASRLTRSLEDAAGGAEAGVSATASAATTPTAAASAPSTTPAAAAPRSPAAPGGLQGVLVGASVAFAAIGSSAAFIVKTVAEIDLWSAFLAIGTLMVMLAALFGLLAWLKLRRRDVSALLEACGWALNSRMRLVYPLAQLFTVRPGVPTGAVVIHKVASGRGTWTTVLLLGLLGLSLWVMLAHPEWVPSLIPGGEPTIPEAQAP